MYYLTIKTTLKRLKNIKSLLTSPRPGPSPKSKPKIPNSQIQKGKGNLASGLSLKYFGRPPPSHHYPQHLDMKEASDKQTQRVKVTWNNPLFSTAKIRWRTLSMIEIGQVVNPESSRVHKRSAKTKNQTKYKKQIPGPVPVNFESSLSLLLFFKFWRFEVYCCYKCFW